MYKVEKSSKGIKLFVVAEAEDIDGKKVQVRKLLKEQKFKEMVKGIEEEKKMYEADIETANGGIKQLEEIKMLIDELNADSKSKK